MNEAEHRAKLAAEVAHQRLASALATASSAQQSAERLDRRRAELRQERQELYRWSADVGEVLGDLDAMLQELSPQLPAHGRLKDIAGRLAVANQQLRNRLGVG